MGPERHEGAVAHGSASRPPRPRVPLPRRPPCAGPAPGTGPELSGGGAEPAVSGTNLSLQGWGPRPGSRRFRPAPSLTAALSLQELAGTLRPGSSPKRG